MARKTSSPLIVAPLQRIVAEPVTDPAEQATIDRLWERSMEKQKRRPARSSLDEKVSGSNSAKKRRA
jgi:hypothetical protein